MGGRPSDGHAQPREELARLRDELAEQRRMNAMLSESVEQFISATAHDIKNPLGAIKLNVEGLRRAMERGDRPLDRLGRIVAAVDQAQEVIAAARARASAAMATSKPPRRQAFDLVALARQVVKPFHHHAGSQRLQLQALTPVVRGEWDEQAIRDILEALIDNALKFSPATSAVVLTLERDVAGSTAILRCTDEGIGIPARDLAHVCERLYRGENVVGRYKGAGLGLFQAQVAVAGHGGQLAIESEEGAGCRVTVVLPLQ